jgi:hypothetical protein
MKAAAKTISIISFFICLVVSMPGYSQSSGYLAGIVLNSSTSEVIPFVRIKLKLNHISIYTNAEGSFRLPLNPDFKADSLIITCIGYNRSAIAFRNLNEQALNKIRLNPLENANRNIKITAGNSKLNSISIIRRAIGNLNSRYPKSPYNYTSYYRDYQKSDTNYINLNEAIVQTVDSGFTKSSRENIYRLMDFRKNPDFPWINLYSASNESDSTDENYPDKLIPLLIRRGQYGKELLTLMASDPIRNYDKRTFSFIQKFSENFINNHNFSPPSEINYENIVLYKIAFNGRGSIIGDSLLVSGAIYIQSDDYSIHKLEYSCYKILKGNGLKKLFGFITEYGRNGKITSPMYLRYLTLSRHFTVFDIEDNSFFRLVESYWDTYSNINPTLVVRFNNKVDPISAAQKDNYIAQIKKKNITVKGIQVVGETIYLRFNPADLKENNDSCQVYLKQLKDINGNILGNRKPIEIYQYREIFVEDVNTPGERNERELKNLPADMDTLSIVHNKEKYWMNSPARRSVRDTSSISH